MSKGLNQTILAGAFADSLDFTPPQGTRVLKFYTNIQGPAGCTTQVFRRDSTGAPHAQDPASAGMNINEEDRQSVSEPACAKYFLRVSNPNGDPVFALVEAFATGVA